ncbi:MAG: hypothetical protein HC879_11945 [Leptolyngbyaceae cyanobacterium SL_5_9]|nr:hypothetical protein [Leptolyngbyaceae cyanobacterium SL_5_9]
MTGSGAGAGCKSDRLDQVNSPDQREPDPVAAILNRQFEEFQFEKFQAEEFQPEDYLN